jgi:hypothetical protein
MNALEYDKLSPTTIKVKCPPFLATILCRCTEETLGESATSDMWHRA